MAEMKLKIWYGKEGDFLEVMFMRVSALQDGAPG
jgi:hypothetical protein